MGRSQGPSQVNIKVENIALNLYFTLIIFASWSRSWKQDLQFEGDQGKAWADYIMYDKTTMIEETKK